jgi:hypothetical protein
MQLLRFDADFLLSPMKSVTDERRLFLLAIGLLRRRCGTTIVPVCLGIVQGLNCQKISGGVDICLFIVIAITHRRFSIINNGGGLKLTPPGYPRASCLGGLGKQLGGFNPPNPPGNSNTGIVCLIFGQETLLVAAFDCSLVRFKLYLTDSCVL